MDMNQIPQAEINLEVLQPTAINGRNNQTVTVGATMSDRPLAAKRIRAEATGDASVTITRPFEMRSLEPKKTSTKNSNMIINSKTTIRECSEVRNIGVNTKVPVLCEVKMIELQ
jgi:hypothetical protein